MSVRAVPEEIRITRIGLVYVLFTLVVGIAATNTGNNALYLALAVMLGLGYVVHSTMRLNALRKRNQIEKQMINLRDLDVLTRPRTHDPYDPTALLPR